MINPETARAVLREYHAAASDQQIVDDLRRHSPELARRLGVGTAEGRKAPGLRGIRGFYAAFERSLRSVLRLFS
jgi:hypothetical protein